MIVDERFLTGGLGVVPETWGCCEGGLSCISRTLGRSGGGLAQWSGGRAAGTGYPV
jgi:hypothetical protein